MNLSSEHRRSSRRRGRPSWLLWEQCERRALLAVLVSSNAAGTGSGNLTSALTEVSGNGRFVAFTSDASDLVPNDTNLLTDVFVRDLLTGTTTLVSTNAAGTASGNGASLDPSISADGRYVAFTSTASNLVAGDTNLVLSDVFVRDLVTGTTTLVSTNAAGTGSGNGASSNPIVSADGSTVAFTSTATDLVTNDTNGVLTDVFARARTGGPVELVSVNAAGTGSGNGASASVAPYISASGQVIGFTSSASNLVATDTNGVTDVFVRNRGTGATSLASVNAAGTDSGNGPSVAAGLSADGATVIFTSNATDLVANDTNLSLLDVFVRRLATGVTSLVSVNAAGTGSGAAASGNPVLSGDGNTVAFTSTAPDLVLNDTNGILADVFARNLLTGTTALVSINAAGTGSGNLASTEVTPAIGFDGRYVAFTSTATDLVPNDSNGILTDVFLRDRVGGSTTLISTNAAGTGSGNLASTNAAMSAGGGTVAFTSTANDLVPNDTNGILTDVFAALLGGQLQISPPGTVSEGSGSATITVTRTGGTVGTVTVDFATSNGTAVAGLDYVAQLGTLTFGPGVASQTFSVPIVADAIDEPDETLMLTLSNPTGGATLAVPPTAVLTIADDDPPPAISIGAPGGGPGTGGPGTDVTIVEGDNGRRNAVFNVTLSAPSSFTVTVNYATAPRTATSGSDFVPVSGTLTFAPGQTTQTVVVPVIGDRVDEPDETLVVNLTNPVNATFADSQGTITIVDDDTSPTARPDTFRVTPGKRLVVPAPGVLGNDTDADGDRLRAVLASRPSRGVIDFRSNGSFIYRPLRGVRGVDHFSYRATDRTNFSAPITVTLNVGAGVVAAGDVTGPMVSGLARFGIHSEPTTLVVSFNEALNAARAQDPTRYRVLGPGPDGRLGTRDDVRVRVLSAAYSPSARTVALRLAGSVPLSPRHLLVIDGTSPAGVTDLSANMIDGNRDGRPGGNVAITFGAEALRGPASLVSRMSARGHG